MTTPKQMIAQMREMLSSDDAESCGKFITACYNLNDPVDEFASRYAKHGFETACDYYKSDKFSDLPAVLTLLEKAIEMAEAYATTDTEKQWCSFIDENGNEESCSTKWFHGVVSGEIARSFLESAQDWAGGMNE